MTLIELMAVVVIIAALTAIALPEYSGIVEKAKLAKAIGDIQALQVDIDSQDSLPANLTQIGRDGLVDPWGYPYVY